MRTTSTHAESSSSVSVIPAEARHVPEIVELHCAYIGGPSTSRVTPLMRKLLASYYDRLVTRDDCALFAAIAEGRVVGYASLVVNQRSVLLAAAARRPVVFLRMGLSGRAMIAMMRYAVRKIAAEFLGHKWPAACVAAGFKAGSELRSIAVMPEWRGRRIAVRLLDAAVGHAASKAWTPVVAWVEETNTPSASALLKAGFRVAAQRVDESGTVTLYSWSSPEQGSV